MKNLLLLLALAAGMMLVSCQNEKTKNAHSTEANTAVTAAEDAIGTPFDVVGVVNWLGSKANGSAHNGTVDAAGQVLVQDNKLVGGDVNIDFNSIVALDLEGEKKGDLEGHLKAPDFFDVATYPMGNFTITSVGLLATPDENGNNVVLTGNLMIRDTMNSISFPAQVMTKEDGSMNIKSSDFKINRTDWGITFHSGVVGTVKDRIIKDDIVLSINLKATPISN